MSIKDRAPQGGLAGIISAGGRVHMLGVLGASMSVLSELLAYMGVGVSGSDDAYDPGHGILIGERWAAVRSLLRSGVRLVSASDTAELSSSDALIYSSAAPEWHAARVYARRRGIPEYCRAELLGAIMQGYGYRIGVSGTHGKSTVTAMLGEILYADGKSPTVLCGAGMQSGSGMMRGDREYLVYEACEYRDSFLHFSPSCAIITNIELDHTDYFPDIGALKRSFILSAQGAEHAVVGIDYPAGAEVARALGDRAVTVGREMADISYTWEPNGGGGRMDLYRDGRFVCAAELRVPGEHNAANAAIAAASAMIHGASAESVCLGLSRFRGVGKRLELLGTLCGRSIYRDYAHHPTEIRCSIAALKAIHGSVSVLFIPHTYTRTRDLWDGFVAELSCADTVGIYDIYPAREPPIEGISSQALAGEIRRAAAIDGSSVIKFLLSCGGSAVVIMGAGELGSAESEIIRLIKERKK